MSTLTGPSFTFPDLIARQKAKINSAITQRNAASAELDELRAQGSTDAERIGRLRAQTLSFDPQIELEQQRLAEIEREYAADQQATRAAEERHPGAVLPVDGTRSAHTSERGSVYSDHNPGEFMRDLFAFSTGQIRRDAQERLERHENEARAAGRYSERATSTSSFAGIVPPQYIVDQYAAVARAGRPTANVVQQLPLPDSGMSLLIPRGTTGASTGVQATENTAVSATDQVWANVTAPVITVAGQQDVSRQAIERGIGTDQIVFGDLVSSYAVSLNQQVLSGTGTAGQALGILNTGGITQATAFTAAATVQAFMSKLAGAINAVQTARFLAPSVIIMHPRRWNWLTIQLDSANRPMVTPAANGPMNALGIANAPLDTPSPEPVGTILGIPVITDASIPTTAGSGPEDQVIVTRREDLILWEDPNAPFTLRFEQPLGNQLTVKLVAYGYAAFTAGRFPAAVSVIGGNAGAGFGLIAPTW